MKLRIVGAQPMLRGVAIMPRHCCTATLRYPSSARRGALPAWPMVVFSEIAWRRSTALLPGNSVQALPIDCRKCASLPPIAARWNRSPFSLRAFADETRPAGLRLYSSMPSNLTAGSVLAATRSSTRTPTLRVNHESGCGMTATPPCEWIAISVSSIPRKLATGFVDEQGQQMAVERRDLHAADEVEAVGSLSHATRGLRRLRAACRAR